MAWEVIEVSRYQTISDYRAVASNINGVLIRVGYRGYGASGTLTADNRFQTHYDGFYDYGRKMGYYFFSAAISEAEAVEEANFVYNLIRNKKCDFPVYFQSDYTNATHTGRSDSLSKAARTLICKAFCERIKALGYRAGVLADDSWYDLELNVRELQEAGYSIIVARHSELMPVYVSDYDAWEYTDQGSVSGYDGTMTLVRYYKDAANWTIPDHEGEPIDINNFSMVISPAVSTYADGEPLTPTVLVYGLKLGTDFVVEYSNNINVGTGQVVITGINQYTGTATKTFTIQPQDLATGGKNLEFHPNRYGYTGNPIIPNYSIYGLTVGVDYTIDFTDNTEVGTAVGTATGIGNYSGDLISTFSIIEGDIADAGEWDLEADIVTYTGSEIRPAIIAPEGLEEGVDYEAFYANNINIGTATVIINGINSYSGSLNLYFNIERANISGKVTLTPSTFVYSGEPCCPAVEIEGLDPRDYEVEYINNINAGTAATIILYGIGNYTGSLRASYKITPRPIEEMTLVPDPVPDQYYNGKYVEPNIGVEGLVKNLDFIVRYKDNHELGSALAEITGIGNYMNMVSTPFNIVECPLTEVEVKYGVASLYTPYRIDNGILVLTAKSSNYTLRENIDYKVVSKRTLPKKEFTVVTFVLTGLGPFDGQGTYNFRVIAEEPTPSGDFDDGSYNFGDLDYDDETAYGDWNFGDIDIVPLDETIAQVLTPIAVEYYNTLPYDPTPFPEPTDVPEMPVDEGDYDFEEFCGIYLDEYDQDDGTNIDENGDDIDWNDPKYQDDGVWNFGDIDEGDETAEGDYDFGCLEEGRDLDSKVKDGDDYDFNIFPEGYPVGKEYELEDTPIYANYCSTVSTTTKSGSYLIYKPQIMQDKIRVTKMENGIGAPARSTGWVRLEDLDRLGLPKLNEMVYVDGLIRRYINSENEYIAIKNKLMYITAIANEDEYEYAYGVSYEINSSKIGWASLEQLTKYNPHDTD